MINFNRSISLCFMTLSTHRASLTTLSLVNTDLTDIAIGTGSFGVIPECQFLSGGAYQEVLLRVVKEALYEKGVGLLFSLLLHMKVIVLHIRNYSLTLHQFIILFTTIACISYNFFTLPLILRFKTI